MPTLESNLSPQNEVKASSKLKALIKTMKDLAATLGSKKVESTEEDSILADGNNPFGIRKLNLAGHDYHQSDLLKIFASIDKKKLETYKKICGTFENLELATLKSRGILLARLLDFDQSLVASPIFVETENDGTYTLEHKTQRQGAYDTRIKLFEVKQTKNNKKEKIASNAQVKIVYVKDKFCLSIEKSFGDPILVPIQSMSQAAKNNEKKEDTENILISGIEGRLKRSKNKKVSDRVKMYLRIFAASPSPQIAEMDLMDKQGDILDLIEGTAHKAIVDSYTGWNREDFVELYKILYGE